MGELEQTLLDYLEENFLPRGSGVEISQDDDLFTSGVIDSAGLIECVVFLEKKYSITIPDEDLLPENFSSISAVAAYLRARLPGLLKAGT